MRDDKAGVVDEHPLVNRRKRGSRDDYYEDRNTPSRPRYRDRNYKQYASRRLSLRAHREKRSRSASYKRSRWDQDGGYDRGKGDKRRNKHARKAAHDFLLELRCGSLNLGPKRGTAPKTHPVSSDTRRVITDIGRAQALIQKLDSEKGILENILSKGSTHHVITVRGLNYVKGLEGKQLLDTLMAYLWSIHGVDYYGMVETSEPKGFRHIISKTPVSEATTPYICEWEMNLDCHWNKRLDGQDPLELLMAKEKIDAAAVQALDLYVRKIGDEMFGCGAKGCTKLFRASKYVLDHLQLKHPDLVMELTAELREDLYFENYMKYPNAPRSIPVIQKTIVPSRPGPFIRAPSEVARRMLR
ncbi:hypothetical protein QQ045_025816 [Rhodiola kirilowii]